MATRVRTKVARVIKHHELRPTHNVFQRALGSTNPFRLNAKDRKALLAYMQVLKLLLQGD